METISQIKDCKKAGMQRHNFTQSMIQGQIKIWTLTLVNKISLRLRNNFLLVKLKIGKTYLSESINLKPLPLH